MYFEENASTRDGGAIALLGDSLKVMDCIFSNNTTAYTGGLFIYKAVYTRLKLEIHGFTRNSSTNRYRFIRRSPLWQITAQAQFSTCTSLRILRQLQTPPPGVRFACKTILDLRSGIAFFPEIFMVATSKGVGADMDWTTYSLVFTRSSRTFPELWGVSA
jgi:hypothetical protein